MADGPVFDRDAALEVVDGRLDILVELAETFLKHYPTLLSPLDDAVKQANRAAVVNAAHDLRGSLAFFGPTSAAAAAGQLEHMATHEGGLEGIERAHETLQGHMNGFVSCLRQFVAGS